jgi:benzaldehyde dehydrogenase (NAD)
MCASPTRQAPTTSGWTSLLDEGSPPWQGCLFDGSWHPAETKIDVFEPATGQRLATVGEAHPAQVLAFVEIAARAQIAWGATYAGQRAAILRRAADSLGAKRGEIASWLIRETGSIESKALFEIEAAVEELHQAAAMLIGPEGHLLSSPEPGRLSVARRVPLGVVGVITPWNFPLLLAMRSIAPALACGNAVILKPDPKTCVTGGVLICRLLEEAGLPPGVLGLTPGGARTGESLIGAAQVRMITFTGSTAVGRRVGELAGRALKKVALELGGNSPLIVLDDCDLAAAVDAGAFGSFFHQGQVCMATSRHIVHRRVAQDYLAGLCKRAVELRVGDPTHTGVSIGPLISERQRDRVHQMVTASIDRGAKLNVGGSYKELFYRPTVLSDVHPGMPAFDEEIFGPVAPVVIAEDDDHAISLANATEYGLAAAIQTGSLDRGMRLAERLRAGMVHVNDQTINDLAQCPMGGFGHSGNGARFGSLTNRDEFSEWQWLTAATTPRRLRL